MEGFPHLEFWQLTCWFPLESSHHVQQADAEQGRAGNNPDTLWEATGLATWAEGRKTQERTQGCQREELTTSWNKAQTQNNRSWLLSKKGAGREEKC